MECAQFHQGTADAMGVPLYLYPDGSVTNVRKIGAERLQRSSLTKSGDPPTIMVWASR